MKKILLLLFMGLFVSTVKAAVVAPVDQRGSSLYSPDFVGVQATSIDSSTGTALVMINSTGTHGVSIGPAIVYGVITSSIAQGDYLVLKDTSGLSTTGEIAAQTGATSLQSVGATIAIIGNWYQQNVSSYNVAPLYPVLNLIKLPYPLQFPNGICANASVAPVSSSGVARWTILWRPIISPSLKTGQ